MDHNFDQFSHCFFAAMGISLARVGGNIWSILFILQGQLIPHFTIEYRSYFTKYHPTAQTLAGGLTVGATETCFIMYFLEFLFASFPNTNNSAGYKINYGKMVGLPFDF